MKTLRNIDDVLMSLLCVIVGGRGGTVKLQFFGKKPSSLFNSYKRMT